MFPGRVPPVAQPGDPEPGWHPRLGARVTPTPQGRAGPPVRPQTGPGLSAPHPCGALPADPRPPAPLSPPRYMDPSSRPAPGRPDPWPPSTFCLAWETRLPRVLPGRPLCVLSICLAAPALAPESVPLPTCSPQRWGSARTPLHTYTRPPSLSPSLSPHSHPRGGGQPGPHHTHDPARELPGQRPPPLRRSWVPCSDACL